MGVFGSMIAIESLIRVVLLLCSCFFGTCVSACCMPALLWVRPKNAMHLVDGESSRFPTSG